MQTIKQVLRLSKSLLSNAAREFSEAQTVNKVSTAPRINPLGLTKWQNTTATRAVTFDTKHFTEAIKMKNQLQLRFLLNKVTTDPNVLEEQATSMLESEQLSKFEKDYFMTLLVENLCVKDQEELAFRFLTKAYLYDLDLDANVYRVLAKTIKNKEKDSSYSELLFKMMTQKYLPSKQVIKYVYTAAEAKNDEQLSQFVLNYLEQLSTVAEQDPNLSAEKGRITDLMWNLMGAKDSAALEQVETSATSRVKKRKQLLKKNNKDGSLAGKDLSRYLSEEELSENEEYASDASDYISGEESEELEGEDNKGLK